MTGKTKTMFRQAAAAAILSSSLLLSGCVNAGGTWYTQVSEGSAKENESNGSPIDLSGAGNMKYSYTLPCFNADGKETELTFGSDEQLATGDWVKLDTEWLRGVTRYSIVDETEVPIQAIEAWKEDAVDKK